jgi:hypothetical protein
MVAGAYADGRAGSRVTDDVAAYVDRSIALAFEKRDAYHVVCKAGYTIAKFSLKTGGAHTATKAGRIVAHHRFTTEDEQREALQKCKDACAEDYGQ